MLGPPHYSLLTVPLTTRRRGAGKEGTDAGPSTPSIRPPILRTGVDEAPQKSSDAGGDGYDSHSVNRSSGSSRHFGLPLPLSSAKA